MQTISQETLSTWAANLKRGDKIQIQKDTGLSQPTIIKAFKGKASQKTILLIDGFFKNKAGELQEAIENHKTVSV